MKYYVSDWNNVLSDVKSKVETVDPIDADALVLWQDVRFSFKDLAESTKKLTNKPVYVVQHGRAASRDYDKPNSFPLIADKFLAWGDADKERMERLGYGTRTEVVGCPLNRYIRPKVAHPEKNVLFIPINTDHEEPENLLVYYELLKLKYGTAQNNLQLLKPKLRDKWELDGQKNVPFHRLTYTNVIAKLLPRHDRNLYHGDVVMSLPSDPKHMELLFNLLANVDCVVTLDESTTEAVAMAMDVPVVCVDIYKYKTLGGQPYDGINLIKTNGAVHCELQDVQDAVMECLQHPDWKREERAQVAAYELSTQKGDVTQNILKAIGAA
jgi:hypothetical protein